jgi:hypothetical protein
MRIGVARAGALMLAGLFAGCSTAGPTHVYLAGPGGAPIQDRPVDLATPAVELEGYVEDHERVVGLAYDYNTDHLWLRVLPGDLLRVVNRPARRIEAEYPAASGEIAAGTPSLDLAVRSADRRVFAVAADGRTVLVIHQLGRRLAAIEPEGGRPAARIGGLAYDQSGDRLLVLWYDATGEMADAWVTVNRRDGRWEETVALAARVWPTSLAFDDGARELLVPLLDVAALGRFDRRGELRGRIPTPPGGWTIDAGKRSRLRLF